MRTMCLFDTMGPLNGLLTRRPEINARGEGEEGQKADKGRVERGRVQG